VFFENPPFFYRDETDPDVAKAAKK